MKRAADWIIEQRKLTQVLDNGQKIPEYGLLPADNLEDNTDWGHWFGVNAEAVRGMEMLADALKDVGAPEAAHYAEEAAAYKADLRDAVLRAARVAPVVRLQNNTYIPYVGSRPYQRIRHFGSIRVAYYSRYPNAPPTLYRAASTRENFAGPICYFSETSSGRTSQSQTGSSMIGRTILRFPLLLASMSMAGSTRSTGSVKAALISSHCEIL